MEGAPKVPARSPVECPVEGRDSPIVPAGKVNGASGISGVDGATGSDGAKGARGASWVGGGQWGQRGQWTRKEPACPLAPTKDWRGKMGWKGNG